MKSRKRFSSNHPVCVLKVPELRLLQLHECTTAIRMGKNIPMDLSTYFQVIRTIPSTPTQCSLTSLTAPFQILGATITYLVILFQFQDLKN